MNPIEQRISDLIRTRVLDASAPSPLGADTPLVEGGLNLDSVNLLELILMVEEEFGVVVEDSDLSLDLLRDVRSLGAFVQARLEGVGPRR